MNNLNDALAWGLVPLYLAAHGAGVGAIGLVAGLYPAVWGVTQIASGAWSDRVGRKPLIVAGMLLQAAALGLLALSGGAIGMAIAASMLLGLGTALVYPTLIAAISDHVSPVARAPVVGVYRFWRDSGYVAGGLLAGVGADVLGFPGAIGMVGGLTAASGLWVAIDLDRDKSKGRRTRTGTPYFGTSVIPRKTTGSGSSRTAASSTREATTRSTSDISAWASAAPMQRLIPPPNGSHA